jgi:hypothetical protein
VSPRAHAAFPDTLGKFAVLSRKFPVLLRRRNHLIYRAEKRSRIPFLRLNQRKFPVLSHRQKLQKFSIDNLIQGPFSKFGIKALGQLVCKRIANATFAELFSWGLASPTRVA